MQGPRSDRKADEIEVDDNLRRSIEAIALEIISGSIRDREGLQQRKMDLLKGTGVASIPTNSMVLDHIRREHPGSFVSAKALLIKKPTRTLSGVSIVAVMTSPHACPHGRCIFCPGGPESEVPSPQSYTGKEPAAMRGAQNDFDPFRQTSNRLAQLEAIGHDTDKVELILMGGTMLGRDPDYQERFVKGCLDAMNGHISPDLVSAQRTNERSPHRCVGMTFETRPDVCSGKDVERMLVLGGTRVEIGFQNAFDGPLKASGRGHTVADSMAATRRSKDAGMKVCYHLMPGMPGSDPEMDIGSARAVFEDPDLRPDMIKIYPTLVIKGTELYGMWERGEYRPYDTEEAARIVSEIKSLVPPWVRVQRVQRDIPGPLVEAGVKNSNLRQIALEEMRSHGLECRCIRCREVGHVLARGSEVHNEELSIHRQDYEASGGIESFVSIETEDRAALVGYVRVRRPSEPLGPFEGVGSAAMLRELKVTGPLVPIGKRIKGHWQHRGSGRALMSEAERIAFEEWGVDHILVNSGIGVRDYYRRIGYSLRGPYMVKYRRDVR